MEFVAKSPVHWFGRYTYVNNHPYKYTDPNGEFAHVAIGALARALISAASYTITTAKFRIKEFAVKVTVGATDLPVASLSGRVFHVGREEAKSTTDEGVQQLTQDLFGESVSAVSNQKSQCVTNQDACN